MWAPFPRSPGQFDRNQICDSSTVLNSANPAYNLQPPLLPIASLPGISNVSVSIEPNVLCAVIGPVGAGKSTLLQIILGELQLDDGFLHVNGRISYASQQPWLFEGSIRQNIVFVEPWDERR